MVDSWLNKNYLVYNIDYSEKWFFTINRGIYLYSRTHVSWCLSDLPSLHDFIKPNILPGQIYSPIQQCSINFNMKTMACRIGDVCFIIKSEKLI